MDLDRMIAEARRTIQKDPDEMYDSLIDDEASEELEELIEKPVQRKHYPGGLAKYLEEETVDGEE